MDCRALIGVYTHVVARGHADAAAPVTGAAPTLGDGTGTGRRSATVVGLTVGLVVALATAARGISTERSGELERYVGRSGLARLHDRQA